MSAVAEEPTTAAPDVPPAPLGADGQPLPFVRQEKRNRRTPLNPDEYVDGLNRAHELQQHAAQRQLKLKDYTKREKESIESLLVQREDILEELRDGRVETYPVRVYLDEARGVKVIVDAETGEVVDEAEPVEKDKQPALFDRPGGQAAAAEVAPEGQRVPRSRELCTIPKDERQDSPEENAYWWLHENGKLDPSDEQVAQARKELNPDVDPQDIIDKAVDEQDFARGSLVDTIAADPSTIATITTDHPVLTARAVELIDEIKAARARIDAAHQLTEAELAEQRAAAERANTPLYSRTAHDKSPVPAAGPGNVLYWQLHGEGQLDPRHEHFDDARSWIEQKQAMGYSIPEIERSLEVELDGTENALAYLLTNRKKVKAAIEKALADAEPLNHGEIQRVREVRARLDVAFAMREPTAPLAEPVEEPSPEPAAESPVETILEEPTRLRPKKGRKPRTGSQQDPSDGQDQPEN